MVQKPSGLRRMIVKGKAMLPDNEDGEDTIRYSLDARRPRRLRDIVGQEPVIGRLQIAIRNGTPPRRIALFGPSGSSKTTLAHTLVRAIECPKSRSLGDACGECRTCRLDDLGSLSIFHEWTGAELDASWFWWEREHSLLQRPNFIFFLDEAQDLSRPHQK